MARSARGGGGCTIQCASLQDLLPILGEGVRREILAALEAGPMDVTTLAEKLKLSVTTVSHHLRPLWQNSLVELSQDKQRHIYSLGACVVITSRGNAVDMTITTADGGEIVLRALTL